MNFHLKLIPLVIGALASMNTFAQGEFYLSPGVNVLVPISSDKSMFPVLGYSRKTDPEVLVGGMGVTMHMYKPVGSYFLKGIVTLGRHVYWEEPVELNSVSASPLGTFAYSTADHTVHILALGVLDLGNSLRLGTGIGSHILLDSRSRLPDKNNSSFQGSKSYSSNKTYKTVVAVIPLELTWHTKKHIYGIRYEQALMNRYKESLAPYRKDLHGILTFEYGWRLFREM